jgi:FtsP/CotA-like multicopper oxidase with cupredoxin domain
MLGIRPALTRRAVMAGGSAVATLALIGCGRGTSSSSASSAGRLPETRIGGIPTTLNAAERGVRLGNNSGPTPAWLYGEAPFPVYRMRLGESLDVTLTNRLKEHTSIHWHGVRGPNAMDGVPYVTQLPVQPGDSFSYRFAPPDAGTYFFPPLRHGRFGPRTGGRPSSMTRARPTTTISSVY